MADGIETNLHSFTERLNRVFGNVFQQIYYKTKGKRNLWRIRIFKQTC